MYIYSVVDLDIKSKMLVTKGNRPSTRSTYSSAQKSFINFCNDYKLPWLPTSEQVILWYIAHLDTRNITAGSMHVYLSAIRSLHVKSGMEVPPINSPRVKLALKAVHESNPPPLRKYPITYLLLCRMFDYLGFSFNDIMYKAALTLAFFGALRSDEYVAPDIIHSMSESVPLLVGHVSFGKDPSGLDFVAVKVERSKTTPHGFTLPIGCSLTSVCAVCTLREFLRFRYMLGKCKLSDHVFVMESGVPLTKSVLNGQIKKLVANLGLDPSLFSSHSLRAGSVSTAASVEDTPFQAWELKSLGNWRSDTYQSYIRNIDMHKIKFAQRLTKTN